MIENDICMLVLSTLVSFKYLLFLCLKTRAKKEAKLPKGYILDFACKTLQALIPLTMHDEPTIVPTIKWLHQAVQYHHLLLTIFLFHQVYDGHHLFFATCFQVRITVTTYDPLLELLRFYSYEGFS
jgi:hypothetical protein